MTAENHDKPEGASDSGTAAILRAIVQNPLSALNMLFVLCGFFATYYTLTHEVEAAKSEVAQVKDAGLITAARLAALDIRGVGRYEELKAMLAHHDTTLAEITTDVRWIVRRLDSNDNNIPPAPSVPRTR